MSRNFDKVRARLESLGFEIDADVVSRTHRSKRDCVAGRVPSWYLAAAKSHEPAKELCLHSEFSLKEIADAVPNITAIENDFGTIVIAPTLTKCLRGKAGVVTVRTSPWVPPEIVEEAKP